MDCHVAGAPRNDVREGKTSTMPAGCFLPGSSEPPGLRRLGEGIEDGGAVSQIPDLGVAVVWAVNALEIRMGSEDENPGLAVVVHHSAALHPQPAALRHGAELQPGVGVQLPGDGLGFPCQKIQPAPVEIGGAERPDVGLAALVGGEEVGPRALEQLVDFLHFDRPFC